MASPTEHYPSPAEVDEWCARVLARAEQADLEAELLEAETYPWRLGVRHTGGQYVRFRSEALTPSGEEGPGRWYGFYQPCPSGRGPLLVHVPGYGAEMSAHPELVAAGYNVLHVNPLGYATPEGPDESKREGDTWPVLPDTVRSLGEAGYVDWLAQAAAAALWAQRRDGVAADRLATFGSSQGGGTALLLASILRDRGVRAAAADVTFLTNFPLALETAEPGAYGLMFEPLEQMGEEAAAAWRALGFVDTTSHAHRLTMPVLLTAGAEDEVCPVNTIRSLFEKLPATRSYTELAGQGHAYTQPFLHLARAWFRLHV
jgi:cephalosporin-C deacetylase-like acetyl esterase